MTKLEIDRIIDASELDAFELTHIFAIHASHASGRGCRPSAEDYASAWILMHQERFNHGTEHPCDDDDRDLGLPVGTLADGFKSLALKLQLCILKCGCYSLVDFNDTVH